MRASERPDKIELTPRQLAGLDRALGNLDGPDDGSFPRGVTLTIAGPRIILESPETNQRWMIGPRYGVGAK